MRTIKLTIAATERQCQSDDLSVCCNAIRRECCAIFGGQIWIDEEYKRLTECMAAEEAETHGA